MGNWRRPIIRLVDSCIKQNRVDDHLATLKAFCSKPIPEQVQVQKNRLADLLRHAAIQVPYYREVLAEVGVFSNGCIDLSLFRHIPFLKKDILRNEFDRLKSADLPRRDWYVNTSGGSTGEPAVFVQDSVFDDYLMATKRLHFGWAGRSTGEPLVKLWGSERDIWEGTRGLRAKLSGYLRNITFLNAFCMSEEDMRRYARIIDKTKPRVLLAYVTSVYELAKYVNSEGIEVAGVGAVMTTAGTLQPYMRQEIREAFGCPAFDRYGSREVGDMGCENQPSNGLLISAYTHLIEVIDPDGCPAEPGQTGEIVVTCLTNLAMPLIRYRIGDRGIVRTTTDGAVPSVLRLQRVVGRIHGVFITADGTKVDGEYFNHIVYYRDWIKRFQFVQERLDLVVLRVVKRQTTLPERKDLSEIKQKIQMVMGEDCQVRLEFVDSIGRSPSGKYRYTVSRVLD